MSEDGKNGVQSEIFQEFEGHNSADSPFFVKQRGRWTRKQMRVMDVLSDPLNSIMTNREIAEACQLSERYLYKLMKDEAFMSEVEKRRKSDAKVKELRARLWKALFFEIEKYPQKIRTAAQMLGELREESVHHIRTYENISPEEIDERLAKYYEDRKRATE